MTKTELDTLFELLDKFDNEYLPSNGHLLDHEGAMQAKIGLENLWGFMAEILPDKEK